MNTCFFDQTKKVVIKVLNDPSKVEREIMGAKALSEFADTPEIKRLDTRTIMITYAKGVPENQYLNELVITSLINRKPCENPPFSILDTLSEYKEFFKTQNLITEMILQIECALKNQPLFPIHGDMQKQNIFIKGDTLSLIDFEHFTYAPLELELVNSVFFRDSNCLDIQTIIPSLVNMEIVDFDLIRVMLQFYAIKQLYQGRLLNDVNKKMTRGLLLLSNLFGTQDTQILNIPKLTSPRYNWDI